MHTTFKPRDFIYILFCVKYSSKSPQEPLLCVLSLHSSLFLLLSMEELEAQGIAISGGATNGSILVGADPP